MKRTIAIFLALIWMSCSVASAADLTCWFSPNKKLDQVTKITDALSASSGLTIKARVAKSYPEILEAFSTNEPQLVYVGSFVQAIIAARDLGTPLVQNANGKEMYSGILVYPAGKDAAAILKSSPADIAFARGASSGESSAKAATGGKASIGTAKHGDSVAAVKSGKARAAVVKNWWWESNKGKYAGMKSYRIPGVSVQKNPDNVLTASKAVSAEVREKVMIAALSNSAAFGTGSVVLPFESNQLDFSLNLMKKGKIDPLKYNWK